VVTNRHLVIATGTLTRGQDLIPLDHIRSVGITQNWRSALFGWADVRVDAIGQSWTLPTSTNARTVRDAILHGRTATMPPGRDDLLEFEIDLPPEQHVGPRLLQFVALFTILGVVGIFAIARVTGPSDALSTTVLQQSTATVQAAIGAPAPVRTATALATLAGGTIATAVARSVVAPATPFTTPSSTASAALHGAQAPGNPSGTFVLFDDRRVLADGAYFTFSLEPGRYSLDLAVDRDQARASWIGVAPNSGCMRSSAVATHPVTAACMITAPAQLRIDNPSDFGFGSQITVSIRLMRDLR
jgi:hypothetical protein